MIGHVHSLLFSYTQYRPASPSIVCSIFINYIILYHIYISQKTLLCLCWLYIIHNASNWSPQKAHLKTQMYTIRCLWPFWRLVTTIFGTIDSRNNWWKLRKSVNREPGSQQKDSPCGSRLTSFAPRWRSMACVSWDGALHPRRGGRPGSCTSEPWDFNFTAWDFIWFMHWIQAD